MILNEKTVKNSLQVAGEFSNVLLKLITVDLKKKKKSLWVANVFSNL